MEYWLLYGNKKKKHTFEDDVRGPFEGVTPSIGRFLQINDRKFDEDYRNTIFMDHSFMKIEYEPRRSLRNAPLALLGSLRLSLMSLKRQVDNTLEAPELFNHK